MEQIRIAAVPTAESELPSAALPGAAPPPAGALVPASAPLPAAPLSDDDPPRPDPADYDWVPVRRRARADGWGEERQRRFVAALADSGSVETAAREVGMTGRSAYALRRAPDAAPFARAWDAAINHAMHRLVDAVLERALHGTDEPVFDREGRRIGSRRRYNDRLAMFLLRAHQPERFGRAAMGAPPGPARPVPALPPVADAIDHLLPAAPPEPHRLLEEDELDHALLVADLADGDLPRWHRERTLGTPPSAPPPALPPVPAGDGDGDAEPPEGGLGPEFDRTLEQVKAGEWVPPRPNRHERRRAQARERARPRGSS